MVVTEALQNVSYCPILRPFSVSLFKFHFPISVPISHKKGRFPLETSSSRLYPLLQFSAGHSLNGQGQNLVEQL